MPNNKEHSDHTLQKLGVEAADLHHWMDQPAEWAGSLHRFFRHDPDNPPEWAVKRYGLERASRIMQHHLELDDYRDINGNLFTYLGDILKKEQYSKAIRSRSKYVKGNIIDVDDDMITVDCRYAKFREGDQIGYLTRNKEIINLGDVFIGGKIIGIRNCNGFKLLEGQTIDLVDIDNSIVYDVQFDIIDKILNNDMDDIQNNLFNKVIGDARIKSINKKTLTNKWNIDGNYELDDSQINVVESILGLNEGELLLVVGPPGTGKTEVIAKAAYELSLRNDRILISSHTNRAVDNVIQKLPVESTIRIGKISKIHKNVRQYSLGEKALKEKGTQLNQIEDEIEELKTNLHNIENPKIDTYNSINGETRKNIIRKLRTNIKNLISKRNDLIRAEISEVLSKAKIFGSTLIKSGMNPLKNLVFDIILIDECSQVPILLAMVGMFRAKKWVLIGDHKQLLPIFQIFNPQKHKKELRALSSFCFFKEKYEQRTLWLKHHYRSNKDIIGFSQIHIYDNNISPSDRCNDIRLKISDTLSLSKDYLNPYKPVVFINVPGTEKLDTSYSKHNLEEIDIISNIVDDIESLNLKLRDTGIITTYRSQMEKLKEKIKKRFLEISTVDSYQGREKDIIIYSVTSTKNFDFVEDENRLNVAFTRAKKKLIVIGNENAILKNSPAGLLSKYISYSKSKYGYYDYSREQTSPDQEGRDWSNTIIEL